MPSGSAETGVPPQIVLCAGLKSSGSTWLYNVTIQLCEFVAKERGPRTRVMPFYAEAIEQFPARAESAALLVVKTHIPSPSLVFLTRYVRGTVFLTVREPRDAVASLMQRFGHEFEPCVKEVAAGAARMVELTTAAHPLVLRYEDRFFDRSQTITGLAKRLGARVPKYVTDRIFRSLSAEKVRKTIAALAARGAFGSQPHPDRFHPRTHWHPGHVGDGQSAKYPKILSPKMQQKVLQSMHEYCATFGYETVKLPSRKRKSTKGAPRDDRRSGIRKSNVLS